MAKQATAKVKKKTVAAQTAAYDHPALRERLKKKILAGTKGGRTGQWSARKAQLLASEYAKAGGGYTGPKKASQKHLETWTKEKWRTASGKKAVHGKTTSRYLPDEAWDQLTPAQKRATEAKKSAASKQGKQFVKNTKKAAAAGKRVRKA